MMTRKNLEDSARLLRVRLQDLEHKQVSENDRPAHQVAQMAIREELTRVGRELRRLDYR